MLKKITIIIFLSIFIYSCSEEISNNKIDNVPPETSLFLFTDSLISQQQSRLTVNWWGDDPDGLIVGYYISWNGDNWTFTTKNDSTFALRIGASDTNYVFLVSAVDNYGNGIYDDQVVQNGINYGPEPFKDANNNGKYDSGEEFIDIGIIDPSPAERIFPIKNTAPTIEWSTTTTLPLESFPVMTIRWEADDLDGIESINHIYIALNDTNNFVPIDGNIRIVTIRTNDFSVNNPDMDIYIDGLPNRPASVKLPGLKLDDNNRIYVKATDISGASSEIISLPDSSSNWFVKKPKGKILLIDDFRETLSNNPNEYYSEKFTSITNGENFDLWDLRGDVIPYQSTTFLETLKLFNAVFWFSNNPSFDLASAATQPYITNGGKICFSFQLPDIVDDAVMKSFLTVDSIYFEGIVSTNVEVNSLVDGYPNLMTSRSHSNVRTFKVSQGSADRLYEVNDNDLTEKTIAFRSKDKKLFYFGLALNRVDGIDGSVQALLEKIFKQEFGLVL
ncbi:MAG: hypothetical protein K8F60_13115 [Melioribacteraceae bacterium]|nr:hypothetical protein [Melioribacteraceae bacterium]